jgi:hypothetical protein
MRPILFLWLMLGMTAGAAAWQWFTDVRRRRIMRSLAIQWRMHYAADDRFRLAERVRNRLPVVGAADVRAWDLMYMTESGRRGYLFTVEFGIGTIGSQRRRKCVAALDEPAGGHDDHSISLRLGPGDLPIIEQYRRLHEERA